MLKKQAITMSNPSKQVDNQGILKVLTRDLGNDNLWELFFDEEDGFPILRLNNKDGVVGPDMVKDDNIYSNAIELIITKGEYPKASMVPISFFLLSTLIKFPDSSIILSIIAASIV